ncbi:HNH endonuclease signature motif containing protein [Aquibacillus saliphilus]|uniref:HNH endonuclease signature motif containing protein n=1 Tax=Aquibacillus saliphilus TaxID=1909422 RepID=UPI001CF013E5|nr:HNH endonuclease signature motif containing protein [Aquibacillus saliphilus]
MSEFYYQEKQRKDGTKYVYYRPDCKECSKSQAKEWNQKHPEVNRRAWKNYYSTERGRQAKREDSKRRRDNGNWYKWLKENKDKADGYKNKHHNHDITKKEWESCKEYFNYKCAYCEMSEFDHKVIYNQQLHKDHVNHEGNDDLSNCVPSCKGCNSSKNEFEIVFWFKERSTTFTQKRLDKINKWLNDDYLIFKD